MINNINILIILLTSVIPLFCIFLNRKIKNQTRNISILISLISFIPLEHFAKTIPANIYIIVKTLLIFFLITLLLEYKRPDKAQQNIPIKQNLLVIGWQLLVIIGIVLILLSGFKIFKENILNMQVFIWQNILLMAAFYIFISYFSKQPTKFNINKKLIFIACIIIFLIPITDNLLKRKDLVFIPEFLDIRNVKNNLPSMIQFFNFLFYLIITSLVLLKTYLDEFKKINTELEIRKSKDQEHNILTIIQDIVLQSEEMQNTLNNILHMACVLAKADGGLIYLLDKENKNFIAKKLNGKIVPPFFINPKILENTQKTQEKILETPIQVDRGIFSTVIKQNKPMLIQTELADPNRQHLRYLREYAGRLGSMMISPLSERGRLFGMLFLQNEYTNFINDDFEIFKSVCSLGGVLISNVIAKLMAKEKQRLENEMKVAQRIQTSILPKKYSIPGHKVVGFMRPAEEVGGDYYDILNDPSGKFWLNIGDVTGHGVTAGLIMLMLQTSTSTTINTIKDVTPKTLVAKNNTVIFQNIRNRLLLDQYITTCFCCGNENGEYSYAGAHEDILIYRSNEKKVESIGTGGMWVGLVDDIEELTEEGSFKLNKNDILLLYTDGVIEIRNLKQEQYDCERLKNILLENCEKEPEEISDILIKDLDNFKEKQEDDITFIIAKKL